MIVDVAGPQMADFGPKTALKVVDDIRTEIRAGRLKSSSHVKAALKRSIIDIFKRARGSSALALGSVKPMVILVVGVNGGGKTTTIGKLAYQLTQEGGKVRNQQHALYLASNNRNVQS